MTQFAAGSMPAEYARKPTGGTWTRRIVQFLPHLLLAVLAVGIAWALPHVLKYFAAATKPASWLSQEIILILQGSLAATLIFGASGLLWVWRRRVQLLGGARIGVVDSRSRVMGAQHAAHLLDAIPRAREAFVVAPTGHDVFSQPDAPLFALLPRAQEIAVLLANPYSTTAEVRSATFPSEVTLESLQRQVRESIRCLNSLRGAGKQVRLKLMDEAPFWKVGIFGERAWVQFCHSSYDVAQQPGYVFALNPQRPREGMYVPFYAYFLDQWNDARHPEYDFETGELVYRDESGLQVKRVELDRRARWKKAERRVLRAHSEPLRVLGAARADAVSARPGR